MLDQELYRNMMQLRNYQGDAADWCLTFAAGEGSLGSNVEVRQLATVP